MSNSIILSPHTEHRSLKLIPRGNQERNLRNVLNETMIMLYFFSQTDDDPPEIACPSNVIDSTTDSTKIVKWGEAVAKDNLGLRSVNPIVYDPPNATAINAFTDDVKQIVTVTAFDTFNNEGTCQFLITLYQVGKIVLNIFFSFTLHLAFHNDFYFSG